jgi:hypothetical protein
MSLCVPDHNNGSAKLPGGLWEESLAIS